MYPLLIDSSAIRFGVVFPPLPVSHIELNLSFLSFNPKDSNVLPLASLMVTVEMLLAPTMLSPIAPPRIFCVQSEPAFSGSPS